MMFTLPISYGSALLIVAAIEKSWVWSSHYYRLLFLVGGANFPLPKVPISVPLHRKVNLLYGLTDKKDAGVVITPGCGSRRKSKLPFEVYRGLTISTHL